MTEAAGRPVAIAAGLVVVIVAVLAIGPLAAAALLVGGVLVLLAPGYALVAALAPRAGLAPLERAVAAIGSSIAVTILTGVVLSLAGVGLSGVTWLGGLLVVTVALATLAWRRRSAPDAAGAPMPLRARAVAGVRALGGVRPLAIRPLAIRPLAIRPLARVRPLDAGLLAAAVLLAMTALGVAKLGVAMQPTTPFTQLWLIPGGGNTVEVGLRSEESASIRYRVVLEAGSRVLGDWSPEVASGTTWDQVVTVPTGSEPDMRALLFLGDSTSQVYRTVTLASPPPSTLPTASPAAPPSPGASRP